MPLDGLGFRGFESCAEWTLCADARSRACRACIRACIQDTILYRSIYMYLLNHTDIRTVHRSLFERRNVLAVFSVS